MVKQIIAMEAAESFTLRSHKCKSQHLCLVFPAAIADLGMVLPGLQEKSPLETAQLCKQILKRLLVALDYLHIQANMIHCDVKPDNILFRANNEQERYADIAKNIKRLPLGARWSRKGRRSTWESVHLADFVPKELWDIPVLGDLGDAKVCDKSGQNFKNTDVCCEPFRPPEVRLEMGWGSEIDIWGVGMVVGIMLSNKLVFGLSRKTGDAATTEYLARMQGVMGKPPKEFLDRVPKDRRYWDKNGDWAEKHNVKIMERPLESLGWKVDKTEEPVLLEFLRGIFTWRPEGRKSARELLESEWLQS
jgi:serine/threonine protein kinase